jgi:hypothetical protein
LLRELPNIDRSTSEAMVSRSRSTVPSMQVGARPMGRICAQGDGLRFHALNCPVHGIDAATDEAEREWSKTLPKEIL